MTSITNGDECFIEDGRRAIYAGEIDGQKFVRILLSHDDEEYGFEEWPSDKLLPVSRILASAPVETYAPAIQDAKARIAALRDEEAGVRASLLDLRKHEQETAAAVKKYPELATAIDFIEGRITHVAIVPGYSGSKILPLAELLTSEDYHKADGLKLVSLFGCDLKGNRKWRANHYRDGSGSWTEIKPFASEADAKAWLRELFEAELELWRNGETKHSVIQRAAAFPESEWPDDWREYVASVKAKNAADRIAKLRGDIAQIEAEHTPA